MKPLSLAPTVFLALTTAFLAADYAADARAGWVMLGALMVVIRCSTQP